MITDTLVDRAMDYELNALALEEQGDGYVATLFAVVALTLLETADALGEAT